MERKKFFKGFLAGILVTVLVGTAGIKVYDVVQSKERNQGAVTDAFVEKAKLIERIVDKKYTGEVDKEDMESMMYKGLMASRG